MCMRKCVVGLLAVVLVFAVRHRASAESITVTTASAQGADAYVRDGSYANNNYGTEETIAVKNEWDKNFWRKAYVRFDLSPIMGPVWNASFALTFDHTNEPLDCTINVYGLNDGVVGENWAENDITWNNAPANKGSGSELTTDATLLGTFSVSKTSTAGDVFSLSNSRLVNFVNADTDDLVTLILTRTKQHESAQYFASKENSTFDPPTLELTPIPTPSTLVGLISIAGTGMLMLLRRRRANKGARHQI